MFMASLWNMSICATLVILAIQLPLTTCIGVNYGMNGDNLPPPKAVVALYKKCGFDLIRLFDPDHHVLEALRGSNLKVSVSVRNEDVQTLASSQDEATKWVKANVAPYKADVNFQWIILGNEIIAGDTANCVTQAMQHIHNAINSIGLTNTKVTTSISMSSIAISYPPSKGEFSTNMKGVMKNVASFLGKTKSPLMVNLYPYFAYASDPSHISLEYATFQAKIPVPDQGLQYFSLFDAMVDAVYAALEKIGAGNVNLIIGETGWPTKGYEPYTSMKNAKAYNTNLMSHLEKSNWGTPRRPGQKLDVFIFAMFNEDKKTSEVEKNWGLFYPNMSAVYELPYGAPSKGGPSGDPSNDGPLTMPVIVNGFFTLSLIIDIVLYFL